MPASSMAFLPSRLRNFEAGNKPKMLTRARSVQCRRLRGRLGLTGLAQLYAIKDQRRPNDQWPGKGRSFDSDELLLPCAAIRRRSLIGSIAGMTRRPSLPADERLKYIDPKLVKLARKGETRPLRRNVASRQRSSRRAASLTARRGLGAPPERQEKP